MKNLHPAIAEHVMQESERLSEALRRIADLPIDRCITENDYRLSAAKAIALAALSQQAEPVCDWPTCECALDLDKCKVQSVEPTPAQDELAVYRAVNQFGSDCHFGVESLARVWAGPKGTVERVTLEPVPELSVVPARSAQTEQQPDDHIEDMRAMVEPAPAQDEREASRSVEPIVRALNASVAVGSDGDWVSIRREHRDAAVRMLSDLDADFRHVYQAYAEAQKRANRPAQTEQQTEQQPEQSGLVLMPKEATPEIVAAMKRELDKAPTWYCRYSAAYRAAMSAQGGQ